MLLSQSWLQLLFFAIALLMENNFLSCQQVHPPAHPPSTAGLASDRQALIQFIQEPDPHYRWRLESKQEAEEGITYILEMQSQMWQKEEVTPSIWRHWLILFIPKQAISAPVLLNISGGIKEMQAPSFLKADLKAIALANRSIVADLKLVPTQALFFKEDSDPLYREKGRIEDEILAYSWEQFLKTGEAKKLAHLPMTKAVIRAMDTLASFLKEEKKEPLQFVLSGASKRGWAAWLASISDERVIALIPQVIDLLNIGESFRHHLQVYGKLADTLRDYEKIQLADKLDSPAFKRSLKIIDPFSYLEQLNKPKLLINAAGDDYFLPDSSHFYFQQLPEPKYLRYIPNAGHSLQDSDAMVTLGAFYHAISEKKPLPSLSWKIEELKEGKVLTVKTDQKPAAVYLWQASSAVRDFRLKVIGKSWQKIQLQEQSPLTYAASLPLPKDGWQASFIELTFNDPKLPQLMLKLTTDVYILPTTVPFP